MISNGDINIVGATQTPVPEKVFPVQAVATLGKVEAHGNNLPTDAAIPVQTPGVEKSIDPGKLQQAVKGLNENAQVIQRELHFSIDDDSGQTVIKVMNSTTNELIRQIPNEETLNIAHQLGKGIDLELFSAYI